jgi:membrane-bound serine protease (ClpP class)
MFRRLLLASLLLGGVAPLWPAPCVVTVEIDSVIHPVTAEIVARGIDQARQAGCQLVLLHLNTPGGFLDATRAIIEKIVSSPVPVAAYVSPGGGRAASAGFLILEAADIAAMAPGTHTGAAHPVLLVGSPDDVMKKKIENDTAAELRTLTDRRGRNSPLAEKAVLESRSFTDQEALREHLIDLIASSDSDLLKQLNTREVRRFDGRTQTVETDNARLIPYELTIRQKVQSALSDPNLALALTVLGALGLYVEFSSPGFIFPGVAGGILLLLGLSSLAVLPLNWTGVALLLLALALFVLEAKYTSHGVLGTGAAVSMVLGALFLIDSPIPEMRIHLSTALGLTLPFAVITALLVTLVVRARLAKPATGLESAIGASAVALTPLNPTGQVLYHGEVWQARASAELPAGSPVRITAVTGLTLSVEPNPTGA